MIRRCQRKSSPSWSKNWSLGSKIFTRGPALEKGGAHVVYGMVGYKTHCKICLVVRQEADDIRRYCHLATGNYNVRTAGVYSDLGLFTCRDAFGQDLTELFNLLTGYTRPQKFNHLLLAPVALRQHLLTQ